MFQSIKPFVSWYQRDSLPAARTGVAEGEMEKGVPGPPEDGPGEGVGGLRGQRRLFRRAIP